MVQQLEEEVWSLLISRLLDQQKVLLLYAVRFWHELVPIHVFGDVAIFRLSPLDSSHFVTSIYVSYPLSLRIRIRSRPTKRRRF
jgi:hypothetical protein